MQDNRYPLPENSKWSAEAILRNRRKRMARRLYKRCPLFACQEISQRFGIEYDSQDLFNDLVKKDGSIGRKRKGGKRKPNGKRRLCELLQRQIKAAIESGELESAAGMITQYYKIQSAISKPWKVFFAYQGKSIVYSLPNRLDHERIADFTQKGKTLMESGSGTEEIDTLYNELIKGLQYGG